jgi:hypothetical protein
MATWTDLVEAELPPLFDGLKRAAREVGGMQIQNVGARRRHHAPDRSFNVAGQGTRQRAGRERAVRSADAARMTVKNRTCSAQRWFMPPAR